MFSIRAARFSTPALARIAPHGIALAGLAILLATGIAPAQTKATTDQVAATPTVKSGAKVTLLPPGSVTIVKTPKPLTPSDSLRVPLPINGHGCYHLVNDVWQSVPCATAEYMKAHRIPHPFAYLGIQATPHPNPVQKGVRPLEITTPFVWGSISSSASVASPIANPVTGSEIDNTFGPNAFTIQTNSNTFICATCSVGYPILATPGVPNSGSAPGDTGWVQFVYTQTAAGPAGVGNSALCVWNVDVTVGNATGGVYGYPSSCVYPSASEAVAPLFGPGAPTNGLAEVIGYLQCPHPASNDGCTLWAVAHLPWSPGTEWWAVTMPDYLGLAGNWNNVSGGMLGAGDGSEAMFYNAELLTTVSAYSCYGIHSPYADPASCGTPPAWQKTLDASPSSQDPTAESNNLTALGVSFQCTAFNCWMTYESVAK